MPIMSYAGKAIIIPHTKEFGHLFLKILMVGFSLAKGDRVVTSEIDCIKYVFDAM